MRTGRGVAQARSAGPLGLALLCFGWHMMRSLALLEKTLNMAGRVGEE